MPGDLAVQLEQTRRLIERLERLSADSYWAHQASGVRGALLRCLEYYRTGRPALLADMQRTNGLDELMRRGYFILEQAARELERRV